MTRYVSNKEINRVVSDAVKRGWVFVSKRPHGVLKRFGLSIPVAGSPRCAYSHINLARDLERAEQRFGAKDGGDGRSK